MSELQKGAGEVSPCHDDHQQSSDHRGSHSSRWSLISVRHSKHLERSPKVAMSLSNRWLAAVPVDPRRCGVAQTDGYATTRHFPVLGAFGVAKRYCVTNSGGDTFEQRRSAMPESPPTTRTPPPRLAALKSPGCWDRPELHQFLDQLRKSDVLVVWKLDRLSRSLRNEVFLPP